MYNKISLNYESAAVDRINTVLITVELRKLFNYIDENISYGQRAMLLIRLNRNKIWLSIMEGHDMRYLFLYLLYSNHYHQNY